MPQNLANGNILWREYRRQERKAKSGRELGRISFFLSWTRTQAPGSTWRLVTEEGTTDEDNLPPTVRYWCAIIHCGSDENFLDKTKVEPYTSWLNILRDLPLRSHLLFFYLIRNQSRDSRTRTYKTSFTWPCPLPCQPVNQQRRTNKGKRSNIGLSKSDINTLKPPSFFWPIYGFKS